MVNTVKKKPKVKNKGQLSPFPLHNSWPLILALTCFLFTTSIGCSTTQKNKTVSDFSESQVQEAEPTRKDFRPQIALFPFENFSEDMFATEKIMPLVKNQLALKGVRVLDEETLERFLIKERIRSTGYISAEMARKMGKELHVEAVLIGSINTLYSGKNPMAGFSARLISTSDGTIIWTSHAAATGNDFTGFLGLGTVSGVVELSVKMTDKLFKSFSMVPPYKERESTYRIAVMPFKNKSEIKGAGMIATYMFITELFKSRIFEPISYGDVRDLVVALRVRSKGELDFKNIGSIEEASGVDGILVGTVEHYSEETGSVPPLALISARLIDARTGKIVWYDGYQYRGDDGISIFDWGRLRSTENVAYVVVTKLVKEMSKVKWQ
jgi:TolB-like protein